jgi:hypothetical protein
VSSQFLSRSYRMDRAFVDKTEMLTIRPFLCQGFGTAQASAAQALKPAASENPLDPCARASATLCGFCRQRRSRKGPSVLISTRYSRLQTLRADKELGPKPWRDLENVCSLTPETIVAQAQAAQTKSGRISLPHLRWNWFLSRQNSVAWSFGSMMARTADHGRLNRLVEFLGLNRLGHIAIHPSLQTALFVTLHRCRREGQYG